MAENAQDELADTSKPNHGELYLEYLPTMYMYTLTITLTVAVLYMYCTSNLFFMLKS